MKSSLPAVITTVTISKENSKQRTDAYQSQVDSKFDDSSQTTLDNITKDANSNKVQNQSNNLTSDLLDESNLPNSNFDVQDPYDPFKPNDYLTYCEERLEQKRLKKLDEENQKVYVELEKKRLEKERERQEAIEEGNSNSINLYFV